MKIIRAMMIVFFLCSTVFIIVALFMSTEWAVERSIVIEAPAEKVFAKINTVRSWPQWIPWNETADPSLQNEFSGPEAGEAAVYRWRSELDGTRTIKIFKSEPNKWVHYGISPNEIEPKEATATLTIISTGQSCKVTWQDHGDMSGTLVGRFFISYLEEELGNNFDLGLAKLKKLLESE